MVQGGVVRLDGLEGSRVLVTAGASGICAVVAERFAEQGARVHVSDVDAGALRAFVAGHAGIGATAADVSQAADVERLYEEALAALGGLDVVVSGAGIAGPVGNVEDIDPEEWRRCLDVNLTGAFLVARGAAPILKRQGSGAIVIISSNYGLWGQRARSAYVASKWALIGLTKTLAMELGPFGVRANAICPGNVEGERIERVIAAESQARGMRPAELRKLWDQGSSMRTFVTAGDVADTILFACSDAGRHISGQALAVDGHTEFV
jgi:NAD(P)-dependent dehydrogenase (short-subunit alcohol dehydrogenase family)